METQAGPGQTSWPSFWRASRPGPVLPPSLFIARRVVSGEITETLMAAWHRPCAGAWTLDWYTRSPRGFPREMWRNVSALAERNMERKGSGSGRADPAFSPRVGLQVSAGLPLHLKNTLSDKRNVRTLRGICKTRRKRKTRYHPLALTFFYEVLKCSFRCFSHLHNLINFYRSNVLHCIKLENVEERDHLNIYLYIITKRKPYYRLYYSASNIPYTVQNSI